MGPGGAPYCTAEDLAQYLPEQDLNLVTEEVKTQACIDASSRADSYLRGRYQLPLLAWGADVRSYTAYIALYLIATRIGFAPQMGSDKLIVERYYETVGWPDKPGTGWFPGVQSQRIHPDVTPSLASPGNPTYDLPQVRSQQLRGWQQTRGGKPVVG
jgi:phage gp36-like protein